MKRVKLTRGQYATVDGKDFEWISKHKWHARLSPTTNKFYAHRTLPRVGGKKTTIAMHRVIVGATNPNIYVDHRNHNTLDNRRENLRLASPSQNQMNRSGACKNSKTGARGVDLLPGGYRARIVVVGKLKHIGMFKTVEEASKAYAAENKKYFGDFGGGL